MIGQKLTDGGEKTITSGVDLLGKKHHRPLVHTLLNTSKYWLYAKAKRAIVKVVIWAAKTLPEPTYDNLLDENSRRLLRERELFNTHVKAIGETKHFVDAAFKVGIIAYEQGGFYKKVTNKVLKDLQDDGWELSPLPTESEWWKEDD